MNIERFKNIYDNQYVAPLGYGFYYNDEFQGTIIWRNDTEGYYIKKLDYGRL